MENNIIFKVIVLGHQGIGKSSILIRYMNGQFSQQYKITVGVQFATKNIKIDQNKYVSLQIWDTAGQQAFKAIIRSFYKGISGVFLVFAIDSQQSLQAIKLWHKQVIENGPKQVVFFLIGTRADLQDNRQVSKQKAQEMMTEIGAAFFIQTSSKTGLNIDQLFQKAAITMYKKYLSNKMYRQISNSLKIKKSSSLTSTCSINIQKRKKIKCCPN